VTGGDPADTPKSPKAQAGAGVSQLVNTMATLRAPGGCPWDGEQDHLSLVQYLLEEAYELAEAIESGTRQDLREELGDVLLQVVFHTDIAAADAEDPFTLDDVASQVAQKLIRRHPYVFSDQKDPLTAAESHRRWDKIKQTEKDRKSVLEGIPVAQPALARAHKVVARSRRAGLPVPSSPEDGIGAELLELVRKADAKGIDAEGALRASLRKLEAAIQAAERTAADDYRKGQAEC
jgi:XTP/dITP diphosphohydrolase